jgi:hypothetical protein
MKITIESTSKIIELVVGVHHCKVQARVWQGETESGVPVQVYVTRIAPEIPTSDPRIDELTAEFERDLMRQAEPRPTVEAIPLRLII